MTTERAKHIKRLLSLASAVREAAKRLPDAPVSAEVVACAGIMGMANWLEDVAALLRAEPVGEPWRPIETAPKDGTSVLIAGGTYNYDASADPRDYPFEGVKIAWWDRSAWNGGNGSEYDGEYWHEPTVWMPLPAPPAAPEAKEQERGGEPLVERVAKAIYDAMRCGDPEGQRRPWIPGGNSLKQSEAREMARIAIKPCVPTVSAEEEK